MRQFNFLTKLIDAEPTDAPFISLYLNAEPNENGKKDFDIFLKKQFNDHLAVLDEESERRVSLEHDREKITDYVETLDPAVRGAAIFACAGGNSFFETFEFEIPFTENRFYLFDRPCIFPLVRLMDQNPPFAVVCADTNSAHIYLVKRAETVKREDIQNTKTNRTEVGGWSQMRFQRHIENFHQQHAKEVVEELEKLVRTDRVERIVLAGDQKVIIPLLKREMSKELSERVVDSLALNVNTPEHEISELARVAVEEHESAIDKERIDHLFDVNYDDGVGVTGVEKTLAALLNGQVQELYLSADPKDIAYRAEDIKVLVNNYTDGNESIETSDKELLIDGLIKLAAGSAERIRFIEDRYLLKSAGGVGAVLRYQTKGASNV
jgi:peptide chain release factor subunit 1